MAIEGVPAAAFVLWDVKNNKPYSADNPLPISGGVSGGGGGGPVTIADGGDTAQGSRADGAWDLSLATPTEMSILKAIALLMGSTNPANVILDPTAKGQQNAAGSLSVVLSSDGPFATVVGAAGDAPATSDTAAATLMAVLRRGLARWTSLFTILPASLGAKGSAASFPVVLASDQARVPTDGLVQAASTDRGGTITTGGTAQQLMAANAARRGWAVQNQSSTDLYVSGLGTAASSQTSLKIPAGALYETPPHHVGTGAVSIFGATTGQAFYAREF